MSDRLYSPSWYRVATLRPRLRSHAGIHRHHYRGETAYVLENEASQSYYRFDPSAHLLLGLMDGKRTVEAIWDLAGERLDDDAPTQDQTIQLLAQLHAADLIQCDVPPDTAEILKRHRERNRKRSMKRWLSPLFWRVPLFDPERLIAWLFPLVRPLFSRVALFIWLGVVSMALGLTALNWQDLTENVLDRVLAPKNLLILWLLFPILKLIHEFGHAFAVKAYGGEVHDMGVMFLVFTPVPYVDASSASAFRRKRERIFVSAAGMMVEGFIASVALLFWLNMEPGLARSVLYNVLFIAGVSTVLFNINPLLRFDGYYMLSDAIEIPNLSTRSRRYLTHLLERHVFGLKEATHLASTHGERAWLVFYAVAAFVYRMLLLAGILWFVAGEFFFIGVTLALWAFAAWFVLPVARATRALLTGPRLQTVRTRALSVTAGACVLCLALLSLLPVPLRTLAEGVVWVPEEAIVRAGTAGFITEVLEKSGEDVSGGVTLIRCTDPDLAARVGVLEGKLEELRARRNAALVEDYVEAENYSKEMDYLKETLERENERLERLTIHSPGSGDLVLPGARDLPGRFVEKGTVLGYVFSPGSWTVRVVVPETLIDLVRRSTRGVQLRLVERLANPVDAAVRRQVPAAFDRLPSAVLGATGGGAIATDPRDDEGTTTFQKFFQFELELPADTESPRVGSRVYVRFDHGWEPLAFRWHRLLRQLFLKRFHV